ncbi:MAG: hypothetical protein HYV07_04675 [Deltaproteobacteria bacterium]|nr:hypothetical protein [Deltaproteobacteria bacterium]
MLAVSLLVSITGTATVTDGSTIARVQARAFEKEGRLIARVGASNWSRGDLRRNPGAELELSWYATEQLGVDLLSASFYFSSLDAAAEDLRKTYGALPDSQRPLVRAAAGPRVAFAYGKMLVESLESIVHFDASVALHLGVLVTDRTANFEADVELALQVLLFDGLVTAIEVGLAGSYEARERSRLDLGPTFALSAGWVF